VELCDLSQALGTLAFGRNADFERSWEEMRKIVACAVFTSSTGSGLTCDTVRSFMAFLLQFLKKRMDVAPQ
jgi:hypothetical protein